MTTGLCLPAARSWRLIPRAPSGGREQRGGEPCALWWLPASVMEKGARLLVHSPARAPPASALSWAQSSPRGLTGT